MFFSCGDVQALSEKLTRIDESKLKEMGRRSKEIVHRHFSAKKMSDNYQQVYWRLMDTPGDGSSVS